MIKAKTAYQRKAGQPLIMKISDQAARYIPVKVISPVEWIIKKHYQASGGKLKRWGNIIGYELVGTNQAYKVVNGEIEKVYSLN